ncbi:MAG: hydrogenase maturation protease [Actinomycetota bacterium]|nr:hydrogenase maturation protease [Actinomycetota bacterium]
MATVVDPTLDASPKRVVVACFGNVLRGDDGFGNVVAERLSAEPLPDGVTVMEVGIGGIHLVQALMDALDALVVVDAVDLGRPPGTVLVMQPDIADVAAMSPEERRDSLADMHYATPDRALMLARALDVLPAEVVLVGCQVADPEMLGEGLTPTLDAAVEPAIAEIRRVVGEFGIVW